MTPLGRIDTPRRLSVALAAGLAAVVGLAACGSSSTTPPIVPVTGVTLDRSTLSFTVGQSGVILVATVSPADATNAAVTWSSSNSAVATVSAAGLVSPVAAGTATITVATQDGGKSATCAVTVAAATVAVTGITLDKTTLNLVAGSAAVKLTATITPANATNKSVTWLSSNTSVATVSDSGDVTPVAAGNAIITAKTADGTKAATCSVTITAAPISVTGVTLDKTTLNLTVNSAAPALVATIAPENASDKAFSWSSDKPNVATVDTNGVVTGKAAGTAIVTVTTHDGSHTATCTVTVTEPSNAVTGVVLNSEKLNMVVGGFPSKLTATVAPANADNPAVTWSSSAEGVATVSSAGIVTAVGSGTADITVTTVEGGFTAKCAVTVHSDAVTSAAATYPITGQIALTWVDPADLNATGIEVTLQSADGSVSRIVQVGAKKAAYVGLTVGTEYKFAVRVLGASGTTSDQVTVSGTPIKVVKVLRNNGDPNDPFYITDTFGSSSTGVVTHDIVMARGAEINDPDPKFALFPKNYRWVLMPGLADPTDPSLVSFKNENYVKTTTGDTTTAEWVETDRYLHIHTGGVEDNGQWYNWAHWTPPALDHVAYADLIDDADSTFATYATFRMVPRADVPGATSFRWLGNATGDSSIIDHSYHITALDSATIGDRFARDSAWFIEDVTTVTP